MIALEPPPAPPLDALEHFFERVHNEPEHAAYLAKKIARQMADSLGNQDGRWFSVRHGREVASLRHWEKRKVRRAKTMRGWGRTPKQFPREISRKTCNIFAAALGVRARSRAALI